MSDRQLMFLIGFLLALAVVVLIVSFIPWPTVP